MKSAIATSLIAAFLVFAAAAVKASDGKVLFDTNCAKCHGPDGKGTTPMGIKSGAKDLADAKVQAAMTDVQIATAIKEGLHVGDKTKRHSPT